MEKYIYIIPEIILSVYALLGLTIGVFDKSTIKASKALTLVNSFLFLVLIYVLFFIEYKTKGQSSYILDGAFVFNHTTFILKAMVCLATSAVSVIFLNNCNYNLEDGSKIFEFPILVVLSVIGTFLMISAGDLITIYLGLELSSLALYVMVSLNRNNEASTEAGIKYFVLGALASGIILYGSSMLYGFSGTTNLSEIFNYVNGFEGIKSIPPALILGFVLVFSGLFFKLSLAPFHMWAPDVYEGSSKIVLSFIATIPKIAAFAVLFKFTLGIAEETFKPLQLILIVVSIASMLIGSFAALRQENIKRLLAYSSVANMGYLLIPVLVATQQSLQAGIVFLAIYLVSSFGVFAVISILKLPNGQELEKISDLAGISKVHPYYAAIMAVFMFSVAGIPPIAGFFGKFIIFKQAIIEEFYTLAIIGVVSSVVSCFYYLRIIKVMYFDEVKEGVTRFIDQNSSRGIKIFICLTVLFTLFLFTFFDSFYLLLKTTNLPVFQ